MKIQERYINALFGIISGIVFTILATADCHAGSYTLSLPAGFSVIANNLNSPLAGGNTVVNVIGAQAPSGTALFIYDCAAGSYHSASYSTKGGWSPSSTTLNPGEGAYINLPGPANITFNGNLPPAATPVSIPPGQCCFLSSQVFPNPTASFSDITGFPPSECYVLGKPNGSAWLPNAPVTAPYCNVFTYINGAWSPGTPTVVAGESVAICNYTNCHPSTNCCDDCTTNNYVSYTVVVQPGFNFLANTLCHATNTTLNVLLPNAPDGAEVYKWEPVTQDFDPNIAVYVASSSGWVPNLPVDLGEGFAFYNSGGTYTNTFRGCEPTNCPLPCLPTNGCVLVGRHGRGTATWNDLSKCPPICGTRVSIWNTANQEFDNYEYVNGAWTPPLPPLPAGQSALICLTTNTNCCTFVCATNKTVPCGTAWHFDPPTHTGQCCTNLTISLLSSNVVSQSACTTVFEGLWRAVDCETNVFTCVQTVTVTDTTPPLMTCVSDKTVPCGTAWTFDKPFAYDFCCGSNVTVQLSSSNSTVVSPCLTVWRGIWQATDCCTNSLTCTQTVSVVDTTAPVLTNCNDIVITASGTNGAVVSYSVTATDACSTNVSVICVPPSGSLFPCGTNVVNCLATDACGNSNNCSFKVVVLCPCLGVTNEHLTCSSNVPGQLSYSFDLQNNTGVPVKYLFLVPDTNCYSFSPDIVVFKPPLLPGQTTNVSVTINLSGPCATNLCFILAAHDSNLVQCCAITHCIARDATGPRLISAVPSCGTNKITVTFDEPLDPASVLGIPNFIVDDLTHLVSLVYASTTFGADYKTVCLFTIAPLSAGTQYRLTVNNVKDACGNLIAPNSQVNFSCPGGPKLNFTLIGGQLCLSWTGNAVLESATSLSPPVNWTTAPDQSNPQCIVPGGGQKFFRLRQ